MHAYYISTHVPSFYVALGREAQGHLSIYSRRCPQIERPNARNNHVQRHDQRRVCCRNFLGCDRVPPAWPSSLLGWYPYVVPKRHPHPGNCQRSFLHNASHYAHISSWYWVSDGPHGEENITQQLPKVGPISIGIETTGI